MKKLQKYAILTLLATLPAALSAQTQETQGAQGEELDAQNRPARVGRQQEGAALAVPETPVASEAIRGLSSRVQIKNQVESGEIPERIVWERLIYRNVEVSKDERNLPLYYPSMPVGNKKNLFTLIFKLCQDGKLPIYKYVDGEETFTPQSLYSFEDYLVKAGIAYEKRGERYVVDETDIPSPEVTQYLVKEGYFFDQATSTFKRQVLAFCPTSVRPDYFGGGQDTKETLFWVKYDDLRPYLAVTPIMISNYNTVLNYTLDDYFNKKMYVGNILKTTNLTGQPLAQQIGSTDPAALRAAEDSIERQIKGFDYQLWLNNDNNDINRIKTKVIKSSKGRTQKSRH